MASDINDEVRKIDAGTKLLSRITSISTTPAKQGNMRELKVWVKSFIPAHIGGFTRAVPGTNETKFMTTQGEYLVGCFATDNRNFSSALGASARISVGVCINLEHGEYSALVWPDGRKGPACGETIKYDCDNGKVKKRGTAWPRGGFSSLKISADRKIWQWKCTIAANDPLVTGSFDIDIDLLFTLTLDTFPDAGTLEVSGTVNDFPAFESYVSVDDGPIHPIFLEPVVSTTLGLGGLLRTHTIAKKIRLMSPTK